jgi:hypothetical protein
MRVSGEVMVRPPSMTMHWPVRKDAVQHRGREHHAAHPPGVAAGLVALRDDQSTSLAA